MCRIYRLQYIYIYILDNYKGIELMYFFLFDNDKFQI